jgi:hypothetical protein
MDVNDIDNLLHEIQQVCLVAVRAHESLFASDTAPGFFQMPSEDAELLSRRCEAYQSTQDSDLSSALHLYGPQYCPGQLKQRPSTHLDGRFL